MFTKVKSPCPLRNWIRVKDSLWSPTRPIIASNPMYILSPQPTAHLKFPYNQGFAFIQLCHMYYALFFTGAPTKIQSSRFVWFSYFSLIMSCQIPGPIKSLHRFFVSRERLKFLVLFMPQSPSTTGLQIKLSLDRWNLDLLHVPTHRKYRIIEAIMWMTNVGKWNKCIQYTEMCRRTSLIITIMSPKEIHLFSHG